MNFSYHSEKNLLEINFFDLCLKDNKINGLMKLARTIDEADGSISLQLNFPKDAELCECETCIELFRTFLMKKYDVDFRTKISSIDFNFTTLENEPTAEFEYRQYISKKIVKILSILCENLKVKCSKINVLFDLEDTLSFLDVGDLAYNLAKVGCEIEFESTSSYPARFVDDLNGILKRRNVEATVENSAASIAVLFDFNSYLALSDKDKYLNMLKNIDKAIESGVEYMFIFRPDEMHNLAARCLVLCENIIFSKPTYNGIKKSIEVGKKILVCGRLFEQDLQLRSIAYLREDIVDFDYVNIVPKDINYYLTDDEDEGGAIVEPKKKRRKKISRKKGRFDFRKFFIICFTVVLLGIGVWGEFAYSQFGPIKSAREMFIGTAMTTATKKWLATWFLPGSEIQRVMALANPELTENTNDEEIDELLNLADIVSTSTPHPKRPLKITELEAEDILKIQKIKTNGSTTGTMYISEAIKGASASVEAKDRYKYSYPSAKRYLIEKGMDSFYVDIVEVTNAIFKGKMIVVSDPSKVVLSSTKKLRVEGEPLATLIKNVGGIGGINAAGYKDAGWVGNGGHPNGLVISRGKTLNPKSWRTTVGFNKKNKLIVGNYTSAQLKKLKLRDAVEFTPALIINGKPQLSYGSNAATGIHPRTAIGQRKDGAVILLTIDGRQTGSVGASNYDCMNVLLENGCVNACNLDGGHSSYMMWRKKFINNPYQARYDKRLANAFVVVP